MAALRALAIGSVALLAVALSWCHVAEAGAGLEDLVLPRGDPRNFALTPENGTLSLTLSHDAGAVWSGKNSYTHGIFSVKMKTPPGFTAGVISTFYLVSINDERDEIDIEILGNTETNETLVHTNWYSKGVGGHEEQFSTWFDPSEFHTYTILWSYSHIVWFIDDYPIRVKLQNTSSPDAEDNVNKPLSPQGSLWDGSQWASRLPNGTIVRMDWSKGPFKVVYTDFNFTATCTYVEGEGEGGDCNAAPYPTNYAWDKPLTTKDENRMKWIRRRYLHYSYLYAGENLPVGGGGHPEGVGGHRYPKNR